MLPSLIVGVVALFSAGGVFLLVLASGNRLDDRVAVRSALRTATEIVPAVSGNVLDEEKRGSFLERVLIPALDRTGRTALRFTPTGYLAKARRRMVLSGHPQPEEFDRFMAVRVVTLGLIPVCVILAALLPLGKASALVVLFPPLLLGLGPEVTLNRKVQARQEEIRRQLTDLSDLLTISVEAGLGFEQALSRTVVSMPGPLSDEFTRMLGETRVGASRRDAFERVGERTDVEELRSFLRALIQAETFGISIVSLLRAQSEEMRISRRQRAQEKAQKAPVKMLFPLVFCILPALFVVVIGPAAIEIYRTVIK
ncbi:MAG TPA: type II secretion system F family protein [Acidimicrobiales bacterium]|nr:type II secretion system F family protein [Acidimicrobiales bacterium]